MSDKIAISRLRQEVDELKRQVEEIVVLVSMISNNQGRLLGLVEELSKR